MNYIEHFTFSFYLGTSLFTGSIKAFIHCTLYININYNIFPLDFGYQL